MFLIGVLISFIEVNAFCKPVVRHAIVVENGFGVALMHFWKFSFSPAMYCEGSIHF